MAKRKCSNLKIKEVEDKYGLLLFRMGLTHLMDVGIRHLTKEIIISCYEQINKEEEELIANGKHPIMTAEFQIQIIDCAYDLAQFSPWDLLFYVKKDVEIG